MLSSVIAVDLAKTVFEIAVSNEPGQVAERHRLQRSQFLKFFPQRPAAIVLMEACGSAHHWARFLARLGHTPLLIPPHAVRPYRTGNKTDSADTKALLEAYRNTKISFVPVKSEAHQAMAALHRIRSGWNGARTARINSLRGLLREFGFNIPVGAKTFIEKAGAIIGDLENVLPPLLRSTLECALKEICELAKKIAAVEKSIAAMGKETSVVPALLSIPGVGPLTATAAWASIVDAARFPSGRMLAASLGLTPREHSSGNRRWLGRITKRGDRYLRMLLIHGGRSVLRAATLKKAPSGFDSWALDCQRRLGNNRAAVAVANKLARYIWAVWTKGVAYSAVPVPA